MTSQLYCLSKYTALPYDMATEQIVSPKDVGIQCKQTQSLATVRFNCFEEGKIVSTINFVTTS